MTFPKTVEEFMDQYKIVDTEKIYSNGIELVPIFRMKQWFEHCSTSPQEMSAVEYLWQNERQLEEYGFKRFLESREDAKETRAARMGGIERLELVYSVETEL